MVDENIVCECAHVLSRSSSVLVITGAGISAESGVQTYRGANGLFENTPSLTYTLTKKNLEGNADSVWKYIDQIRIRLKSCEPNVAHRTLAKWESERRFERFLIATQNTDGLHLEAGSKAVTQIHGSVWQLARPKRVAYTEDEQFSSDFSAALCDRNNEELLKRWSEEDNREVWEDRTVPFQSIPLYLDPAVRPNVLFFGELYGNRLLWVEQFIKRPVDCVLVIGCSGGVDILERLIFQCRLGNAGCSIINVNPSDDCITKEHLYLRSTAGAALLSIDKELSRR
ncbi:MAG: Sir2 family NAD-dependent protein deacetylase [Gammaproteobacteria bacterium]